MVAVDEQGELQLLGRSDSGIGYRFAPEE